MSIVRLDHLDKSILFGVDATDYLYGEIEALHPYKIGLVTDEYLAEAYKDKIEEFSRRIGLDFVEELVVGEGGKTLGNAIELWKKLVFHRFTRKSMLIGFGGGVVSDLTGFVSSTYMRGILYVNIPTTLLSQADAAVGGKNGVNFTGKNIIGSFYIPTLTIIDPMYLQTLPKREFVNGMVEIIKHGIIDSPSLIQYIKRNIDDILKIKTDIIEKIILESIKIKLKIVFKDPFENGLRRVLNLGHSIGHAIEKASGYSVAHGEAVSLGIVVSMKLGESLFNFNDTQEIMGIMKCLDLPTQISISPHDILVEMKKDKKAWYGKHIMIVPREIGDVDIVEVDEHDILRCLRWIT